MIRTFANRVARDLYASDRSKHFPPDIARRAVRKLEYLDPATCPDDLRAPPSNRLHALSKGRKGQYSISINDQWRICFQFVDGGAYDVEICDYH
ncbi:MAG: type II toxin-antitoxin system RelE/ParE family toxin [Gammaproteobacteria bacterium]|nr:type II toxin-antitoxin system RelE/ParE family toxin [Gammaproteobacteria bacterium]